MAERSFDRHSHIYIGLRLNIEGVWHPIRAVGWNAQGFNFYSEISLQSESMQLKRATTAFEGQVLWVSENSDKDVTLAAIINEMLFKQAQSLAHHDALRARLFKLLRAPWLTNEKRKVLASLGITKSDSELETLIAHRTLTHRLFHYGIKVDSDVWRNAVNEALQVSSVVLSLEKLTAGLGNAS